MNRDRWIVVGGHVVWLCLLIWTALAPPDTFPNTLNPLIGVPWTYLWLILLIVLWTLMLPFVLRDSRIDGLPEDGN